MPIDPMAIEAVSRDAKMREFDTGATRNNDDTQPDYEGFLSPLVIERFGEYMNKNRVQADGSVRASDNWQKGIPLDSYMVSGWRHFFTWWRGHRFGGPSKVLEEALCGLMFNAMGYLHEYLSNAGTGEEAPYFSHEAQKMRERSTL